ncbi:hypothetical protein SAMD00019534_032570 [Acytostelium subglobosum LB1]|uniref:hypothetical protein n=1 Tax=Acytostelium subglobosum LB1 TaxID=1410327 RepID=UPI000644F23C|nr:hypothetical protein SAMD00019534_032570 [Acytostelium subglobosum LB1]GAM20082.1 hypothetical protein SAMD00019534_032570 [Acytostelium subglobosum LB1]|eukprot:XP_012756844.1 hypothetical protein SAMD00019534_032570 [Acytostelium subglobosum LB1]
MNAFKSKSLYKQLRIHINDPDNGLRTKMDHWRDASSIIRHKHWGLLRYRMQQGHPLNFTFDSAFDVCAAKDIDRDTFMAVYTRYQSFFIKTEAYAEAIKSDNMIVVQTLLHQTVPVTFDRDPQRLEDAALSCDKTFKMLKYLMDSGLFDNSVLWTRNYSWYWVFSASPSAIRFILDPANFPQVLIDKIKARAPHHPDLLIAQGDQQLIDKLLFKDGKKLFWAQVSSDWMHPQSVTPADQLAHFERIIPEDEELNDQARMILESFNDAWKMYVCPGTQHVDIGPDQRLVFIKLSEILIDWSQHFDKLGEYIMREYIKTGDCAMLQYFFIHRRQWARTSTIQSDTAKLIEMVIKHGTIKQVVSIFCSHFKHRGEH